MDTAGMADHGLVGVSRLRWGTQGGAGLLLAGLIGLASCDKPPGNPSRSPAGRGGPVPVKVAVAERRDVPVQITAIARVEAYQTVTVKPRVAGQVSAVHFRERQDVQTGDLLVSLAPRPSARAFRAPRRPSSPRNRTWACCW